MAENLTAEPGSDGESMMSHIRILISDYLYSELPQDELKSAIEAINHASIASSSIFRENQEFLGRCFLSILQYEIKYPVPSQLIGQFIETLSNFLSLYPISARTIFISRLISSISLYVSRSQLKVATPEGSQIDVAQEIAPAASVFLLRFLDYTLLRFQFVNDSLLSLASLIFSSSLDSLKPSIAKCLAHAQPYSIRDQIVMLRLIFNVSCLMQTIDESTQEECDTILSKVAQRMLPSLPSISQYYLAEEGLSHFMRDSNTKFIKVANVIFKILSLFIDVDHSVACLNATTIIQIFRWYYNSESFVEVCRILSAIDPTFIQQLISKLPEPKAQWITAITSIQPNYCFNTKDVESLSPSSFVNLCCSLRSISPEFKERLKQSIESITPKSSQLLSLYQFIPNEITQVLLKSDAQTISEFFESNSDPLERHFDSFFKFATESHSIHLCLQCCEKGHSQVEEFLLSTDISSWSDPLFAEVLYKVFGPMRTLSILKIDSLSEYPLKSLLSLLNMEKSMYPISEAVIGHLLQDTSTAATACVLVKRLKNKKEFMERSANTLTPTIFDLYLKDHDIFAGVLKIIFESQTSSLKNIEEGLIPQLVSLEKKDLILTFLKESGAEGDIKTLLINNLPAIFHYLFTKCEVKTTARALNFLKAETGIMPTELMNSCFNQILLLLIRSLGNPDPKIVENAKIGICIVWKANHKSSKDDLSEIWNKYLQRIIYEFTVIISKDNTSAKMDCIRSLTAALRIIDPSRYQQICSVINLGIKAKSLRELCLAFWSEFVNIGAAASNTLLVISQVAPLFEEYKSQVTYILTKVYSLLPKELTLIPIFRRLEHTNISSSENPSLTSLCMRIQKESPPIQKLLLEELLSLIHNSCSEDLTEKLWRILTNHEQEDSEFNSLCGRCLCLLPYPSIFALQTSISEVELDSIIRDIIVQYLSKMLDDSVSADNHLSAEGAIQELLKQLGCYGGGSEDVWDQFPEDIKALIDPYRTSLFKLPEISPIKKQMFDDNCTFTQFIVSLTSSFLSLTPKLFCIYRVLQYSTPLCKYILPYLCKLSCDNEESEKILTKEFHSVFSWLDRSEAAILSMRFLFSLFESLFQWKIGIVGSNEFFWKTNINVASHEELSDASFKCDLFCTSLLHFELSNFGKELGVDQWQRLKDIYSHLDDIDGQEYLSQKNPSSFLSDETLSYAESKMLTKDSPNLPLISAMISCGKYETAWNYLTQFRHVLSSDKLYEPTLASAALRLSKWDDLAELRNCDDENILISKAILSLQRKKFEECQMYISEVQKILSIRLREVFTYNQMYPILLQLRLMEEIRSYTEGNKDFERWMKWTESSPVTLEDLEKISAVRASLFSICFQDKPDLIAKVWLDLARSCRKTAEFFKCEMFCSRASKFCDSNLCIIETAKLSWARQQKSQALELLNSAMKNDKKDGYILYLFAKWSEEIGSMEWKNISKMYLDSSVQCWKAYLSLASLGDQRVESLMSPSQDSEMRSSKSKFWASPPTFQKLAIDLKDATHTAISSYIKAMELSPECSQEVVPRLLAIFFDIGKKVLCSEGSFTLTQKDFLISSMISEMQPAKKLKNVWPRAITQLISRIDQPPKLEKEMLSLIAAALEDSADACLWHLMSLKHSYEENRRTKFEKVASNLLSEKYEKVTALLLQLIKVSVGKQKAIAKNICPQLFNEIHQSMLLMPTNSALSGKDSPKMQEMAEDVEILRSMQKPKKISIISTSGISFYFLLKKDDDLRKDMRIMEFASFVNLILFRNRSCRQRGISLTTYSVICLDEQCAMIEWVEHTRGLGHIVSSLLEERAKRIKMEDIKRLLLEEESQLEESKQEKQKNFITKILKDYPPMLHLWFAQHFVEAPRWFQSRLLFSRSVAAWSMVGWVVGLGDRHAENLLINEETGSIVHVDFSCIFDRGKSLNVPEVVPFRLTQNLVSAMGSLGVNGAFSRCCTLSLEALRAKKAKLVSVLQPLVNDPLLEWKKGNVAANGAEIRAQMTLNEVERRLSGNSDGRTQNAECIVRELTNEATDNEKLAMMFSGWQAFI